MTKKTSLGLIKKKVDISSVTPAIKTERISLKSPVAQIKVNNPQQMDLNLTSRLSNCTTATHKEEKSTCHMSETLNSILLYQDSKVNDPKDKRIFKLNLHAMSSTSQNISENESLKKVNESNNEEQILDF